ncbi:Integrase catalytic region [Thiorhodococcus drewsii AZ1]|uniref:Integrase catalytic region n=1 Tax=Thiorhodococcus drewsii AZ1 TaxID=765913 RepID=G2E6N9_9GAMM|nr:Integrase catalytic region [Thiorhodococcus drewsii AZ1]
MTVRFLGSTLPTGQHRFDQVCSKHAIEHRLTKPRTPQTNGMVERFNGRIAEVLATTRFDSSQSLEQTITRYVQVYNQHIPQKALGHIAPIQALKDWAEKRPELFKKRVYNLRGLDTPAKPGDYSFYLKDCSYYILVGDTSGTDPIFPHNRECLAMNQTRDGDAAARVLKPLVQLLRRDEHWIQVPVEYLRLSGGPFGGHPPEFASTLAEFESNRFKVGADTSRPVHECVTPTSLI